MIPTWLLANQEPEVTTRFIENIHAYNHLDSGGYSRVNQFVGENTVKSISFYVVAHQDDWQLFMNPSPFQEILNPNNKVVFIYLTAGDGGRKSGPQTNPYYVARNNAARQAVRFMVGSVDSSEKITTEIATLNGHKIEKSVLKNSASYFFNLPDGNFDGEGFEATGWSSLKNFHSQKLEKLNAVDDSATYVGWKDLIKTIDALIRYEIADKDFKSFSLNLSDTDENLNRFDHSDHYFTGVAVLTVAKKYPEFQVRAFLDYVTKDMPINLAKGEFIQEAATFAATSMYLIDSGYPSTWDNRHTQWLGKNYFRVIQKGEVENSTLSTHGMVHH